MRVEIGESDYRIGGSNVDPDNSSSLFVEMEESRPPAAQDLANSSLSHPALVDQLLGDHRDRAALQPRVPSQVSARDRLMTPYQVQHDAPVDISRRFACSHLKISEIDLPHLGSISSVRIFSSRFVRPRARVRITQTGLPSLKPATDGPPRSARSERAASKTRLRPARVHYFNTR